MTVSTSTQGPHYTAIVHALDGVRFIAAARFPDQLAFQVVEYIRQRCDDVLWPRDAARVRALIDAQKPYGAIALYFECVGDRWDPERLELGGLSFGISGVSGRRLAEAG